VAQPTLGATAGAIGVQGGRCAPGHEEAIEVETVIWFGIAAIIVIALVIAAIGSPGDGPGRHGRSVGGDTRHRVGSRSGSAHSAGHSSAYVASGWSDTGSNSCGGDSSGGGCGGGF
jgi:hypothetical protein